MNKPPEPQRFAKSNPASPESVGITVRTRDLRRMRDRAIRETERFLSAQLTNLRETEPLIAVGESALSKP